MYVKKFASLIVSFCITLSLSVSAFSEENHNEKFRYTALGDSIAAYYGVEKGEGYAELLAEMLRKNRTITFNNLAVSGDDSNDLLTLIKTPDKAAIIKNSDLVTISIGGNNFIGSLLDKIMTLLKNEIGGSIDFNQSNLSGAESKILEEAYREITKEMTAASIFDGMDEGIQRLKSDIPKIIAEIKKLSPNAQICLATVYNPLSKSDALYTVSNIPVQITNTIIKELAVEEGYTVVDIYAVYNEKNAKGLSNYDLASGNFDIHPSKEGHKLIAKTHYSVISNNTMATIAEDKPLTRGEAVGALFGELADFNMLNMENLNLKLVTPFSDVNESNPYYNQIMLAKALGLVSGVGNAKFNPNDLMTRQDFAVAAQKLIRFISNFGIINVREGKIVNYDDLNTASTYAVKSLETIGGLGILKAENNKIKPFNAVTMQDIMAFQLYLLS